MAASKYYKYGPHVSSSTDETFKKIYVMVTHFFKFSCFIFKNVLKILAPFLAFSKAG